MSRHVTKFNYNGCLQNDVIQSRMDHASLKQYAEVYALKRYYYEMEKLYTPHTHRDFNKIPLMFLGPSADYVMSPFSNVNKIDSVTWNINSR
jgi:hypothetical protein